MQAKLWRSDWLSPQDVYALIPWTCENASSPGERDFADVIMIMHLKKERLSQLLCIYSLITWTIKSAELIPVRGRKDVGMSERSESWEGLSPPLVALKMEGTMSQGMWAASRSQEWTLANSQQRKGDLSVTIAWNWILPTIRMSLELNSSLGLYIRVRPSLGFSLVRPGSEKRVEPSYSPSYRTTR